MNATIETRESIGILSFFLALAIAGGALGVAAVDDFSKARASLDWATVESVILSGEPKKLRYAYYYEGRTHEAGRLRFHSARFDPVKKSYAAGDRVDAHISPADPALAVLIPGGSGAVFTAAIIFSGFLIFIGLGGAVRAVALAPDLDCEEQAAIDVEGDADTAY